MTAWRLRRQDSVDVVKDERLAEFVVKSHRETHPNAQEDGRAAADAPEERATAIDQTMLRKYLMCAAAVAARRRAAVVRRRAAVAPPARLGAALLVLPPSSFSGESAGRAHHCGTARAGRGLRAARTRRDSS